MGPTEAACCLGSNTLRSSKLPAGGSRCMTDKDSLIRRPQPIWMLLLVERLLSLRRPSVVRSMTPLLPRPCLSLNRLGLSLHRSSLPLPHLSMSLDHSGLSLLRPSPPCRKRQRPFRILRHRRPRSSQSGFADASAFSLTSLP